MPTCPSPRRWADPASRGRPHRSYFGGALDFVGKQHKKDASKARIDCAVTIGPRDGGGFGLAVKLHVEDKSLPQTELEALAKEAHEKICSYSHATRGNVDVTLEVVGA